MNKKTKIVVSSIATIFLILLYGLIFSFSGQDGETSGGLSRMISEKFVAFLNVLSGKKWSPELMENMVMSLEGPIRKLAHFGEYAVMGMLLFIIWYPWVGLKGNMKKPVGNAKRSIPMLLKIIVPWIFFSAVFDEIHQLFIPGRYGSFMDVLLDTIGGIFGVLSCCLYIKIRTGRVSKGRR